MPAAPAARLVMPETIAASRSESAGSPQLGHGDQQSVGGDGDRVDDAGGLGGETVQQPGEVGRGGT